jgi:hypothetical protein
MFRFAIVLNKFGKPNSGDTFGHIYVDQFPIYFLDIFIMQKVKDHRKAGAEDTTLEKKIEKGNVKGIGAQYRNYQKTR